MLSDECSEKLADVAAGYHATIIRTSAGRVLFESRAILRHFITRQLSESDTYMTRTPFQ